MVLHVSQRLQREAASLCGIITLSVEIPLEPFPLTPLYFPNSRPFTTQLIETTGREAQSGKIFRLVRNVLSIKAKSRKRISASVPKEEQPWQERRSK